MKYDHVTTQASCSSVDEFVTPILDCEGLNSCKDLYISSGESHTSIIEELSANGMFSLQNSEIYSNGNDGITNEYYFYGWYSGYGTSIHCQEEHVCTITCKNNGCKGLTIDYEDSSSVTIDCDETNGHLCMKLYCIFILNINTITYNKI